MKELINIFYMPFSTATRTEVIMIASFLLAVFFVICLCNTWNVIFIIPTMIFAIIAMYIRGKIDDKKQ